MTLCDEVGVKLAKMGKTAEILPVETQKPQKEANNSDTSDKKAERASEKEKASDIKKSKESNGTDKSNSHCEDSNKKDEMGEMKSIDSKNPFLPAEVEKSLFSPIVTAVPQVNCAVAPSMAHASANPMASHAGVYYPVEPVAVLLPYYTMNAYSNPQPCCIRDNYYREPPVHHAPPVQSQAMGFADYFNEDNTAGCNIM